MSIALKDKVLEEFFSQTKKPLKSTNNRFRVFDDPTKNISAVNKRPIKIVPSSETGDKSETEIETNRGKTGDENKDKLGTNLRQTRDYTRWEKVFLLSNTKKKRRNMRQF